MHIVFDRNGAALYSLTSALPAGFVQANAALGRVVAEVVRAEAGHPPDQYLMVAVRKEAMPTAADRTAIRGDGRDVATIGPIPPGAEVRVDGRVVRGVADAMEFCSTFPGTYRVEIAHPMFRAFAADIVVEAADEGTPVEDAVAFPEGFDAD